MTSEQPRDMPNDGIPPTPVGYVMTSASAPNQLPQAGQVIYEAPMPGSIPATMAFDQERLLQARRLGKRANILTGVGFIGTIGINYLPFPDLPIALIAVLSLAAIGCWLVGCMTLARSKGYPPVLGIVGILGLIGFIILRLLPNKYKEFMPAKELSPAARSMRRLVRVMMLLLIIFLLSLFGFLFYQAR